MRKVLTLIYEDYRRYRVLGSQTKGSALAVILLSQGFWATTVYRFSNSIVKMKPSFFRRFFRVLFLFIEKFIQIITGISLPGECEVGKGLYIGHYGLIIINPNTIIGDYCNLSQGTTIGKAHRGKNPGTPIIGDRVYIGPNAVLFGKISIGNDVAIGAGSIITSSIEDRSVVVGNPGKVISYNGSFELVNFDQMELNIERIKSLELRKKNEGICDFI